ncbi:hypothetical protein NHL50_15035 [Acidimicrobiia bacterium EGI L10123]|nr:hypothetical protein [Acidimicrobiia bacterium EGI L10123]
MADTHNDTAASAAINKRRTTHRSRCGMVTLPPQAPTVRNYLVLGGIQ